MSSVCLSVRVFVCVHVFVCVWVCVCVCVSVCVGDVCVYVRVKCLILYLELTVIKCYEIEYITQKRMINCDLMSCSMNCIKCLK